MFKKNKNGPILLWVCQTGIDPSSCLYVFTSISKVNRSVALLGQSFKKCSTQSGKSKAARRSKGRTYQREREWKQSLRKLLVREPQGSLASLEAASSYSFALFSPIDFFSPSFSLDTRVAPTPTAADPEVPNKRNDIFSSTYRKRSKRERERKKNRQGVFL